MQRAFMDAPGENDVDSYVWPGLVDVIIATLMIMLLFMIIQHITFFLSDAMKRLDIRSRQDSLITMIQNLEQQNRIPMGIVSHETQGDQQKLRFSSEILFPSGEAKIPMNQQSSFEFLDEVGKMLSTAYYEKNLFDQIFVEGHTDSSQMKSGRFPRDNWELSAARALYITKYFIDKGYLYPQMSKERFLCAAGYGEFNFVEPNETDEGKSANRRIEILLIYQER